MSRTSTSKGVDDGLPAQLGLLLVEEVAAVGEEAVFFLLVDEGHGLRGHAQGADLVRSGAAGELAPGEHGKVVPLLDADAAAVEQQGGRRASQALPFDPFTELENPCPFEEEVPFLGEEQAEAGEVDLLLVRLHLGEVGLPGQVEGQRGGKSVLEVEAGVEGVFTGQVRGEIPPRAAQQVGDDRHRRPAAKPAQALEHRQARGAVAAPEAVGLGRRHEEDLLVPAAYGAADVDAPDRLVAVGVAQLVEGNGDLGAPAEAVDAGAAAPDAVPGLVAGAALVGEQLVLARPEGIGAEVEAPAAVVVGVEDDLDVVVLLEVGVPPHLVGHEAAGFAVEAAKGEVQVVVVEEDPDLGPLRGRGSFDRLALKEAVHDRGLAPDRIVEAAVDARGLGRAGSLDDRGFPGPGRGGEQREKEGACENGGQVQGLQRMVGWWSCR